MSSQNQIEKNTKQGRTLSISDYRFILSILHIPVNTGSDIKGFSYRDGQDMQYGKPKKQQGLVS